MPRAGLNADLVVDAAVELVDDEGLDQLTLTALAERFGVAVPSLYKHVDGLEDLHRRVATVAVRELADELARAVAGAHDQPPLDALARAYRDFARRHPGRYAAGLRAPGEHADEHRAATEAALATVLDVLECYGLTGDDAVDAARTVRSALHGFASLEAAGGFGLPHDVERSFARLVEALRRALTTWR